MAGCGCCGGTVITCCPSLRLPNTIHATISGTSCIDGTYVLTLGTPPLSVCGAGSNNWFFFDSTVEAGGISSPNGLLIEFCDGGGACSICVRTGWSSLGQCNCINIANITFQCSPFQVSGPILGGTASCCGSPTGVNGTITITR